MVDNQLYILLKKKNLRHVIKEVFHQKEVTFVEGIKESTWSNRHRHQLLMNRHKVKSDGRRPDWFLKDLHDKMNYMRK